VLVERSTITRRAARIARRFHLAPQDADLLRLTVGGYAPQEIAHRFGQDATAIDALRARLPGLLGCDTLREVVEMVTARRRDDAINVLVRFSELRRDLQQLSSL
jgi:DNA-binding CsgD family transcriptional regulator